MGLDYSFIICSWRDWVFENFSGLTRWFVAPIYRLIRVGAHPSDALGHRVSVAIQADESLRGFLTNGVHSVTDDTPGIGKLNYTYKKLIQSEPVFKEFAVPLNSGSCLKRPLHLF